ncbi:hypothetical protein FKG94_23910 [Exilibacterium tricleocarpae]|uniref:Alginate export domain-containing protein n=1 Tax=Exilibacterium tricleocarpae TaxID=2591008 RepID=A0A545ST56_9GAMM|nr:DUF1302 family protein [Exilibacterium tricleocarpae]TQV68139.1 hypothetical protein FKG94_23910 [Exilibacterium tricleocarpae]
MNFSSFKVFDIRCLFVFLSIVTINGLPAQGADLEEIAVDDVLDTLVGTASDSFPAGSGGVSLSEFSGYLEVKPRLYLRDRNSFFNDEQMLATAELELEFSLAGTVTGYVRPQLLVDVVDDNFQRFELFEAYLTYEQESWDIRLGQFVENWGIADTFNPLDILNRRDLGVSLLDSVRLGETGVRGRWLWTGGIVGEPTVAVYFLPRFQITRFAPDRQRLGLGSSDFAFDEKRGVEPTDRQEHFYALRFQSTFNLSVLNADFQLVAAKGPDRNPFVTQLNTAALAPVYYGNRMIGAGVRAVPDFTGTADFLTGVALKLEMAYHSPYKFDDTPIPALDSYLSYVVGFDRVFYTILSDRDELTLTVEFAGEAGVSRAESLAFSRPFSRDIITRVLWQAGNFSRSSLELRGIYDLDNDEHVVEGTATTSLLRWHEDLKVELSVLYINPATDQQGAFSQLPDNTSVSVTLRFDF